MCRETVWAGVRSGEFQPYAEVGRWWYGEDEIDIVALDASDDRILLGECKWTSEPVRHPLVADLRETADRVRWGPDDRTERFTLFSKSRFVEGLADDLGDEWSLFDLDRITRLLDRE